MATPKATLWELDPHTIAKHEILVRYLGAWFPILNAHHGRIVYIDGFSGPGRYSQGEPGSPILALDVAVNHRKSMSGELVFLFIEEREDRLSHLRHELSAIPVPAHFKVIAEPGRFDERLSQVLDSIDADSSTLAPTFAFVDLLDSQGYLSAFSSASFGRSVVKCL
ncbi:MAG: three-Cys-motif partner protein TcmP [Blastocatellia bacterium]|nr:three-Cys-motif partner protein TcmP [Blastocatellia bacterium]